jgi:hypothetical protein
MPYTDAAAAASAPRPVFSAAACIRATAARESWVSQKVTRRFGSVTVRSTSATTQAATSSRISG